jgi:hypothetical protein
MFFQNSSLHIHAPLHRMDHNHLDKGLKTTQYPMDKFHRVQFPLISPYDFYERSLLSVFEA